MGSCITLSIGELEIDWAKNHIGIDHSPLFIFPDDIKKVYHRDEGEEFTEEYCARKLSSVKNRLDLLGYSLPQLPYLYEQSVKSFIDEGYKVNLSYKDYEKIVVSIDLSKIPINKNIESYSDYILKEYVKKIILENNEIKHNVPVECLEEDYCFSPLEGLSDFLMSIDPYIIMRLLAENSKNLELEIKWDFREIVESGWVKREDIFRDLLPEKKILVVTEGSTDSYIIKKSIEYLNTDISDFFEFIDTRENHPFKFPFTGDNLRNFCIGLDKIKIQNKVIIILDNDTAGIEQINSLSSNIQSKNILIICLPKHDAFTKFKTLGPQGESYEDVNGKAVSIECFLDFSSINIEPKIRWTSYSEKIGQYQGSLIRKDDYTRKFKGTDLAQVSYDCTKLQYLISYLIQEWTNFQAKNHII